jgi:hypothetical protein
MRWWPGGTKHHNNMHTWCALEAQHCCHPPPPPAAPPHTHTHSTPVREEEVLVEGARDLKPHALENVGLERHCLCVVEAVGSSGRMVCDGGGWCGAAPAAGQHPGAVSVSDAVRCAGRARHSTALAMLHAAVRCAAMCAAACALPRWRDQQHSLMTSRCMSS